MNKTDQEITGDWGGPILLDTWKYHGDMRKVYEVTFWAILKVILKDT